MKSLVQIEDGSTINVDTGELVSSGNETETLALISSAWKALSQASSFDEIKGLRDLSSTIDALTRKRDMSREAQNEAAKIHLAASIRLGDWLRNAVVKAKGAASNKYETRLHSATASTECDTYAALGLEKTDAFRVQRLYDWENKTAGASKAVQELEETHRYRLGDRVQKRSGGSWRGRVVGWYWTALTPEGYAVESAFEPGSVQIYPVTALEPWEPDHA